MRPANPNMLVLREYQRFSIGSEWQPGRQAISSLVAGEIARFQKKVGREVLRLGYRSGQATNWVGTLGVGRRYIEVVPKIDDPSDPTGELRARENLLYMVSRAGYVPLTPAEIVRLADPARPLLAAFLDLFLENLALEWRRGAVKTYQSEEENRTFLRGKMLFPQQLRYNLVHREKFYTVCDEFTIDNPVSRLLKAGLRACAIQVLSDAVARKARGLLADFDGVGDSVISGEEASRIKVDRQHSRFEPIIALARLILSASSPETGGEGEPVYSLMFDMNEVFERFVAAEMRAALAGGELAVIPQMGGRSLVHQGGRGKFSLQPDIGILDRDRVVCLLDTKWKRLDPDKSHSGVSQSDMYQMYAYGKEYDSPLVVLLYPKTGALDGHVAEYAHHQTGHCPERRICLRTVDVSRSLCNPENVRRLRRELVSYLEGATFVGVSAV